ncbi:taurine--2-oxoglutarate transaminase [Kineosphaera limosa]|uniref:Putative aminotransferase n=1 Tax=Kineosphaera limosa NBRC 100340 TaxID=1184609 RepID=K6VLB4_9MICO|nr:aspartate aminotransferase family protein [Kineosphaera limosa]NYE00375.1 taurine--2-oxoglutarate transaminase [Kineosphaera limosa]GAB97013.1 putative aminotransferase [Kineosphaera limosa NBRC 100340]
MSEQTNADVIQADNSRVLHSWSAQAHLDPFTVAGGSGCELWDYEGNRYLDFSSQLVFTNIGHGHPKVVEAIAAQARQLPTIAPATANAARARAAELVLQRAPEGFSKVFFTNGGADANENAIRMARLVTGRDKIVSRYRSYHGNTGAAIVATGDWRRIDNEYARGHVHVFGPYLYRTQFWATSLEEESERALQHLEAVIQAEGPSTVAAILLETIPGTAGIMMPPPGYLPGVGAIADKYDLVLILDEVMAGFGRTGQWLALDAFDVRPDLITFAKGSNSGYVPVGGVMVDGPIASAFDERVFPGGLTYSGHPLAAASIVANLEAMADEDVVGNADRIGRDSLGPGLHALAEKHEVIGEVRGTGVFWALELVTSRETREPVPGATIGAIKNACRERGLIVFPSANRIHMVPPAVVTAEQVERALAILDEVLAATA